MSLFHRVDEKRARLAPPTERRLTPSQSAIIIAVLSAVSWGVLAGIVLALRALL